MNQWHAFDVEEAGRALGHDIHAHSCQPRQQGWPAPVREGFDVAAHAGLRRRPCDRFVAKWLQLRLSAWRRGKAVAPDVTPALIEAIDTALCPVLRVPLTHGTGTDTDWSIDRLNNDAAYAASNLAVMSVRANHAKGTLGFDDVLARSRLANPADGLSPSQWLRMAVLMLGPAHVWPRREAPLLPLCAPLPCRSVRLAPQQIQRLLTEHCARHADRNRIVRSFASACCHDAARFRLEALGLAVYEGLKRIPKPDERWDVWLMPCVMTAFQRWMDSLDGMGRQRVAEIAGRLSQARRETPEKLRAWHLPTRGLMQARAMRPALAV